jgi:hypothetical protein
LEQKPSICFDEWEQSGCRNPTLYPLSSNLMLSKEDKMNKISLIKISLLILCLVGILFLMKSSLAAQIDFQPTSQSPYPPPGEPTVTVVDRSRIPPTPLVVTSQPGPKPTKEPSEAGRLAIAYVAQREQIPEASLQAVYERPVELPNLGKNLVAVKVKDMRWEGQTYSVLVDPASGEVFDEDAVLAQEDIAREDKYGKFQPALYEKLQEIKDSDFVTVTIWVAAGPGMSVSERQQSAFATLAARYPEADAAMKKSGLPMDVGDPKLSEQIYNEYIQILNAGNEIRIQPLVDALKLLGATPQTSEGLPAVTVSLRKKDVMLIAQRSDVGTIYLAEGGQPVQNMDTAIPTDRVASVWAQGFDGTGTKIAITKYDNVGFDSPDGSCHPRMRRL